MSKLQDKLFGKVTIRKKLTMTTAVVFFLVLSMFTLVVVFSANTLLLQRERQNVNNTISKVVTYIEKDWDSDEELSPEPLLAALYSPKNIYASIINGVLKSTLWMVKLQFLINYFLTNLFLFMTKRERLSLLLRKTQTHLQACLK